MITKLGDSIINLAEVLYITPQAANPNVADICFKSGKTIAIAADGETIGDWCKKNIIPTPGERPPYHGPQGPKSEPAGTTGIASKNKK